MKLIEIENLWYRYQADGEETPGIRREIPVLKGIDLTIEKGQFVAVLGHNGSGKSTLAKHLNGILQPSEGTVLIKGMDTRDDGALTQIRQTVGMVFQNPDNQIVATVVEEDVAFAPENLGLPQSDIIARVEYALSAVGMTEYRRHAPHRLSGAQKQRVAIAGVIAMFPECIVLDEPTAMLDPKGRREVLETIRRLNVNEGITVVLITHYMNEAALADRVVVMDEGKILLDDSPRQVFRQAELLRSVGLEAPQVTVFAQALGKKGYGVPGDILYVQECADAVAAVLDGKGGR